MFASKLSTLTTEVVHISIILSSKLPVQLIASFKLTLKNWKYWQIWFVSRAYCRITVIGAFVYKISQFSINVTNLLRGLL